MKYIKTFEFFSFGPKKVDPKVKVREIISELWKHGYNFEEESKLKAFVSFSSSTAASPKDAEVWIHKGAQQIYLHPRYEENKLKIGVMYGSETTEVAIINLEDNVSEIVTGILDFIKYNKNRYYKKFQ